MFELTINNEVYQFRFGLGFVREVSKKKHEKNGGGNEVEVGLQYAIADIIDENPLGLVDILLLANKTEEKRITKADLENYIENCEDLEGLFAELLDFLKSNNSTKKATVNMIEFAENEKKKAAAKAAE